MKILFFGEEGGGHFGLPGSESFDFNFILNPKENCTVASVFITKNVFYLLNCVVFVTFRVTAVKKDCDMI